MDVIIRVNVVRSYGVKNMIQLLRDSTLFNEGQGSSVQEVLYAAAWIVGEFSSCAPLPYLMPLSRRVTW